MDQTQLFQPKLLICNIQVVNVLGSIQCCSNLIIVAIKKKNLANFFIYWAYNNPKDLIDNNVIHKVPLIKE